MAFTEELLAIRGTPKRHTDEAEQGEKQTNKSYLTPAEQLQQNREQAIEERAAAVLSRYQEAVKYTELLQADILKGARSNADMTQLFLKAALALSLAVNNKLYYEQVAQAVYDNTGVFMAK